MSTGPAGAAELFRTEFTLPLINDPQSCEEAAGAVKRLGAALYTGYAMEKR